MTGRSGISIDLLEIIRHQLNEGMTASAVHKGQVSRMKKKYHMLMLQYNETVLYRQEAANACMFTGKDHAFSDGNVIQMLPPSHPDG